MHDAAQDGAVRANPYGEGVIGTHADDPAIRRARCGHGKSDRPKRSAALGLRVLEIGGLRRFARGNESPVLFLEVGPGRVNGLGGGGDPCRCRASGQQQHGQDGMGPRLHAKHQTALFRRSPPAQ